MLRVGQCIFAALGAIVVLAACNPADAGRRGPYGAPDFVVAESDFGHGTVTGPVRARGRGYEVRMPGGTWIACRRSCTETLRVEALDFWENQGKNRIDSEAGLFGKLRIERRF